MGHQRRLAQQKIAGYPQNPPAASGDLTGRGERRLQLYLSRWATRQRIRLARGRVALAGPPVGTASALCALPGQEPHLWRGDSGDGGRARTRAFLSAVFGDNAERPRADPKVASSQLDRVCLSGVEAPLGDGVMSSAQRRCLLRSFGVTSDGEFRVVLHVACDLQRTPDHGGDQLQPEALLAFC